MFKAACCITASVLLFLPIAYYLYSAAPVDPAERAVVADRFVMPEYCRPEPGERLVYLAGIVFLPLALFGMVFAWHRWGDPLPPPPSIITASLEIAVAVALTLVAWLALLANGYFHLRLNEFFQYPLLAIPILPAALLAMRWDWAGKRFVWPLVTFCAFGLAGVAFLGSVFNDTSLWTSGAHFNAVFFPVVQVFEGKALLVNCASQYGLYPQLLLPLFRLISLSVLSFTLVMGILTAGSFAALWGFLARACENKSAAFIGFAALLFNSWFSFTKWANFDLYFQYFPIRLIFPALLVLLAWQYLRRPTRRLYWGLLIFLGVGVLWNLDAGLPSLLAWTITLCFAELFGSDWQRAVRRIGAHLAAAGIVMAAIAILYAGVIRLCYGAFPDYGQIFYYQRLYFLAGYYKTPLTPPTTWVLVVLVYLAGLAYAAFALAARQTAPRRDYGIYAFRAGRRPFLLLSRVKQSDCAAFGLVALSSSAGPIHGRASGKTQGKTKASVAVARNRRPGLVPGGVRVQSRATTSLCRKRGRRQLSKYIRPQNSATAARRDGPFSQFHSAGRKSARRRSIFLPRSLEVQAGRRQPFLALSNGIDG